MPALRSKSGICKINTEKTAVFVIYCAILDVGAINKAKTVFEFIDALSIPSPVSCFLLNNNLCALPRQQIEIGNSISKADNLLLQSAPKILFCFI